MTAYAEAPATEFGTGLLRTTVFAAADGSFRWRRSPGPLSPAPFELVSAGLAEQLRAACVPGGARLVLGVAEGESRSYLVWGAESVAKRLLDGVTDAGSEAPIRAMGRTLRALHACEAPTPGRTARGLIRLHTWLTGRAPSVRAAQVASQLRRRLGGDRWDLMRRWCAEVVADEDMALSHGAAGLGSLIGADLLIGEDVCAAPWYVDLGWVVGELVEFRWQLGGDQQSWQRLVDALFDGYGRDLGADWHRIVTLRILLHVHDIAAYLGGHTAGFAHYADFLAFLVDL